jgi:glycosyltransferase involved in cell wall biosynthesis
MSGKPLVSAIIIFLDEERFLPEAIESVFSQTYEDWELLLVDDGSTDASTQIALSYAQRHPDKVRYLEHPGHQNRAMSASRNLGIEHARGEYIAFLDADDVWLPGKLERQVALMEAHPEAGMLYSNRQHWYSWTGEPEDVQRDFVPEMIGAGADALFEPPELLPALVRPPRSDTNPWGRATTPCPSDFLVRREVVERVGGFEEAFIGAYQLYEDQAFLSKVCLKEAVFVAGRSEPWSRYRQHPDTCNAVVWRAGKFDSARLFFLDWLGEYLFERGIKDAEVWKLLREERLFARVRVHVHKREWTRAARNLLVMLWHHPRAFERAYQKLGRRLLAPIRRPLRSPEPAIQTRRGALGRRRREKGERDLLQ